MLTINIPHRLALSHQGQATCGAPALRGLTAL
jgi:hypothetical protein